MADKEPNKFKQALADACGIVDQKRSSLAGDGGLGSTVTTKIATHEGWVCEAADDWVADFTGMCPPVMSEFDTAWTELDTAWANEPDEVDKDDPRGNSYAASVSRPNRMPI